MSKGPTTSSTKHLGKEERNIIAAAAGGGAGEGGGEEGELIITPGQD